MTVDVDSAFLETRPLGRRHHCGSFYPTDKLCVLVGSGCPQGFHSWFEKYPVMCAPGGTVQRKEGLLIVCVLWGGGAVCGVGWTEGFRE